MMVKKKEEEAETLQQHENIRRIRFLFCAAGKAD
jgi:hypothetical protein